MAKLKYTYTTVIMKQLLLIQAFIMFCFSAYSQNGEPADKLFREALSKGKKENKNVFVIFTATWCGPCKILKRGLYDVYIASYFQSNYVILELYDDEHREKEKLENAGTDSIRKVYNKTASGIPLWLIVNPAGKKLYEELGFSDAPEDLKKFIAVLKKTSRLKEYELEMILSQLKILSKIAVDK